MEKLTMCRVCLSEEVQLQYIHNTHLEEVYESLTSKPFVIQDGRPLRACYICCAQLENCYRLQKTCLRSEELFTQLLSSNDLGPLRLAQELSNRLKIVAVVHLSTGGVLPESRGANIKKEPTDILDDAAVEGPDEMEDERRSRLFEDLNSWETEHTPLYRLNSGLNRVDINLETEQQSEHSEGLPDDDDCWTQEEDITLFVANNELQDADADEAVRPVLEDSVATAALENVPSSIPGNDIPHAFVKTEPQDVGASSPVFVKPEPSSQTEKTADIPSYKQELANENTDDVTNIEIFNSDDKNHVTTPLKGNAPRVYTRTDKKTKTHPCDNCKEAFSTKIDLLKHVFLVHPCQKNDETNTSNKQSSLVTITDHEIEKNQYDSLIGTDGGTKLLQCDVCDQWLNANDDLKAHFLRHSENGYQCYICNMSFHSKADLNIHKNTHLGYLKCDFCHEGFSNEIILKLHMKRFHSGQKRFQCENCSKCFSRNSYLNHHMREHFGTKPFQCNQCEKCFQHKNHLTKHILSHGIEKPYQCNDCQILFKCKASLTSHFFREHVVGVLYQCEMCKKKV